MEGICKIKQEFLLLDNEKISKVQSSSERQNDSLSDEPPTKKSKSERKHSRGQNKGRRAPFQQCKEKELCNSLVNTTSDEPKTCSKQNCIFLHDINEYLKNKPEDIGNACYIYEINGYCNRGLACRFGKSHISDDGFNIIDKMKKDLHLQSKKTTLNQLSSELQNLLRKRKYDFSLSEAVIKFNDKQRSIQQKTDHISKSLKEPVEENAVKFDEKQNLEKVPPEEELIKVNETVSNVTLSNSGEIKCNEVPLHLSGAITDEDIIKLQQREKKKIDWKNKLFLSPLTTVGNLPFRRICKEFGVDITCGEMAMCSSLLQGAPQEWALVKRHTTEDIFGVQLCANNPHVLSKCAQMLQQEIEVDFIDLNLGCPIDLVYKEGGGCGMLNRARTLELSIKSLSQILEIPLTVKTRTGVYKNSNVAHKLVPQFRDWGASLVTVHGRSREQRYTRLADWNYIRDCAVAADPLPVLGNGDVLSSVDYQRVKTLYPEVAGVMIGRGALYKPWIFTEMKEQKIWDISSSERFDVLKKYVNYGLEHWGSDIRGVENTRRFLLEWLSFLHRYIPVGVLEQPPQKINERPPYYIGRNDLETLMASASCSDWIKISEMLLGPVPENYNFLPKHRASAY